MGQVTSFALRKINRFNVGNRAQTILEREKPTPAPKFESNLRDMERTLEMEPNFLDKLNKKDMDLNQRLKNVYVTSKDIDNTVNVNEDKKLLPTRRHTPEDFEFGFMEPKQAAIGRCTLRQALEFIMNHQSEPKRWTVEKIANDYKMKTALVGNIVQYFKSYNVYIPNEKGKDTMLTQSKRKLLTENKDTTKS